MKALLARRPALGAIFGCGLLALLGFPPFSLFISEFTMARAEVDAGLWWVVALSLAFLSVIFVSITNHARHLLLGGDSSSPVPLNARAVIVPLVTALGACAFIGVSSWPLLSLLHAAAHAVAR